MLSESREGFTKVDSNNEDAKAMKEMKDDAVGEP
jgi:hypothetical protein